MLVRLVAEAFVAGGRVTTLSSAEHMLLERLGPLRLQNVHSHNLPMGYS